MVFISSTSALGNRGQANYAAAKAGIAGLTLVAAAEMGRYGVTVNAIAPGYIQTAMTDALGLPVERLLEHLDGMAIVRRDAFTNGQWDVPGAELIAGWFDHVTPLSVQEPPRRKAG